MKKSPIKRFTPLKAKTPLKRTGYLKRKTPLKPISDKAKLEYQVWIGVKRERVKLLIDKFGFLICEFCKKPITYGQVYDGHHFNRNRRDNTLENQRIVHRIPCHGTITDNNISVESLL